MANYSAITENLYAAYSRNPRVAAIAVIGVLIWLGLVVAFFVVSPANTAEAPALDATATTSALVLTEAEPMRIRIPAVGIDAAFETPLGLEENQEIQVPEGYETVGYYKYGPTPGELGPAVILGHVDSVAGPAVFFSLGQLEEGDEIEVEREDGTTATFAVTRLERHAQSGFPTREVYGDIDHAGLRLITCSGTFDRGAQRYSHNLIVFAELVATSTATVGE